MLFSLLLRVIFDQMLQDCLSISIIWRSFIKQSSWQGHPDSLSCVPFYHLTNQSSTKVGGVLCTLHLKFSYLYFKLKFEVKGRMENFFVNI